MLHVIDNAVKFADEDSFIHIRVRLDADGLLPGAPLKLTSQITNEGIGMTKEQINTVMHCSQASQPDSKQEVKGLQICKRICAEMQATIEIKSNPSFMTVVTI